MWIRRWVRMRNCKVWATLVEKPMNAFHIRQFVYSPLAMIKLTLFHSTWNFQPLFSKLSELVWKRFFKAKKLQNFSKWKIHGDEHVLRCLLYSTFFLISFLLLATLHNRFLWISQLICSKYTHLCLENSRAVLVSTFTTVDFFVFFMTHFQFVVVM